MNQKNIVFVTEIKALSNKDATSTHIMSYNLLKGLYDNGCNITLLALYSGDDSQVDEIKQSYSKVTNDIICIKSLMGINPNKYKQLAKMFYYTYFSNKHKKLIPQGLSLSNSILISHNPSVESVLLCRYMKKECSKYIQYWSDPIALSGIYPEDLNVKRLAHKIMENKYLSYADKIIYGTKVLFDAQKDIFKKHKDKMDYIDISYIEKDSQKIKNKNNKFLYAGNYFSNIRNLEPLYSAFNEFELGELAVYGSSDLKLEQTDKVKLHERISPDQLKDIEKDYDNVVCITNTNCLQIPGKIFYDMSEDKNILVILDGKYKKEIKSYLDSYKRFITCFNDKNDIKQAIQNLKDTKYDYEYVLENYSPKKIAETLMEKI